jgi:hypothetical protein
LSFAAPTLNGGADTDQHQRKPRVALTPSKPAADTDKKAAREAAQQDILLREVDEAVRQDEAAQFAQRYGRAILVLLVVGLLAFGGWLFWKDHREGQLEEGSEAFVTALDELQAGNADTADTEFASLADDSTPAARAGAQMLRAGIAAQKGATEQAAEMYFALADDGDAPQAYRDLAAIRGVAARYDAMQPQAVIDRLKPLATPGNPWFASAAEMVAMAYLEQDKRDLAGPLFAAIAKDEEAPQSIRSRARQMSGLLGVDAIEDVEETLAEAGGQGPGATAPAAQ